MPYSFSSPFAPQEAYHRSPAATNSAPPPSARTTMMGSSSTTAAPSSLSSAPPPAARITLSELMKSLPLGGGGAKERGGKRGEGGGGPLVGGYDPFLPTAPPSVTVGGGGGGAFVANPADGMGAPSADGERERGTRSEGKKEKRARGTADTTDKDKKEKKGRSKSGPAVDISTATMLQQSTAVPSSSRAVTAALGDADDRRDSAAAEKEARRALRREKREKKYSEKEALLLRLLAEVDGGGGGTAAVPAAGNGSGRHGEGALREGAVTAAVGYVAGAPPSHTAPPPAAASEDAVLAMISEGHEKRKRREEQQQVLQQNDTDISAATTTSKKKADKQRSSLDSPRKKEKRSKSSGTGSRAKREAEDGGKAGDKKKEKKRSRSGREQTGDRKVLIMPSLSSSEPFPTNDPFSSSPTIHGHPASSGATAMLSSSPFGLGHHHHQRQQQSPAPHHNHDHQPFGSHHYRAASLPLPPALQSHIYEVNPLEMVHHHAQHSNAPYGGRDGGGGGGASAAAAAAHDLLLYGAGVTPDGKGKGHRRNLRSVSRGGSAGRGPAAGSTPIAAGGGRAAGGEDDFFSPAHNNTWRGTAEQGGALSDESFFLSPPRNYPQLSAAGSSPPPPPPTHGAAAAVVGGAAPPVVGPRSNGGGATITGSANATNPTTSSSVAFGSPFEYRYQFNNNNKKNTINQNNRQPSPPMRAPLSFSRMASVTAGGGGGGGAPPMTVASPERGAVKKRNGLTSIAPVTVPVVRPLAPPQRRGGGVGEQQAAAPLPPTAAASGIPFRGAVTYPYGDAAGGDDVVVRLLDTSRGILDHPSLVAARLRDRLHSVDRALAAATSYGAQRRERLAALEAATAERRHVMLAIREEAARIAEGTLLLREDLAVLRGAMMGGGGGGGGGGVGGAASAKMMATKRRYLTLSECLALSSEITDHSRTANAASSGGGGGGGIARLAPILRRDLPSGPIAQLLGYMMRARASVIPSSSSAAALMGGSIGANPNLNFSVLSAMSNGSVTPFEMTLRGGGGGAFAAASSSITAELAAAAAVGQSVSSSYAAGATALQQRQQQQIASTSSIGSGTSASYGVMASPSPPSSPSSPLPGSNTTNAHQRVTHNAVGGAPPPPTTTATANPSSAPPPPPPAAAAAVSAFASVDAIALFEQHLPQRYQQLHTLADAFMREEEAFAKETAEWKALLTAMSGMISSSPSSPSLSLAHRHAVRGGASPSSSSSALPMEEGLIIPMRNWLGGEENNSAQRMVIRAGDGPRPRRLGGTHDDYGAHLHPSSPPPPPTPLLLPFRNITECAAVHKEREAFLSQQLVATVLPRLREESDAHDAFISGAGTEMSMLMRVLGDATQATAMDGAVNAKDTNHTNRKGSGSAGRSRRGGTVAEAVKALLSMYAIDSAAASSSSPSPARKRAAGDRARDGARAGSSPPSKGADKQSTTNHKGASGDDITARLLAHCYAKSPSASPAEETVRAIRRVVLAAVAAESEGANSTKGRATRLGKRRAVTGGAHHGSNNKNRGSETENDPFGVGGGAEGARGEGDDGDDDGAHPQSSSSSPLMSIGAYTAADRYLRLFCLHRALAGSLETAPDSGGGPQLSLSTILSKINGTANTKGSTHAAAADAPAASSSSPAAAPLPSLSLLDLEQQYNTLIIDIKKNKAQLTRQGVRPSAMAGLKVMEWCLGGGASRRAAAVGGGAGGGDLGSSSVGDGSTASQHTVDDDDGSVMGTTPSLKKVSAFRRIPRMPPSIVREVLAAPVAGEGCGADPPPFLLSAEGYLMSVGRRSSRVDLTTPSAHRLQSRLVECFAQIESLRKDLKAQRAEEEADAAREEKERQRRTAMNTPARASRGGSVGAGGGSASAFTASRHSTAPAASASPNTTAGAGASGGPTAKERHCVTELFGQLQAAKAEHAAAVLHQKGSLSELRAFKRSLVEERDEWREVKAEMEELVRLYTLDWQKQQRRRREAWRQ